MYQKDIAEAVGCSPEYFCNLVREKLSASKKLAMTIGKLLKTGPDMWMFDNMAGRKAAVDNYLKKQREMRGVVYDSGQPLSGGATKCDTFQARFHRGEGGHPEQPGKGDKKRCDNRRSKRRNRKRRQKEVPGIDEAVKC